MYGCIYAQACVLAHEKRSQDLAFGRFLSLVLNTRKNWELRHSDQLSDSVLPSRGTTTKTGRPIHRQVEKVWENHQDTDKVDKDIAKRPKRKTQINKTGDKRREISTDSRAIQRVTENHVWKLTYKNRKILKTWLFCYCDKTLPIATRGRGFIWLTFPGKIHYFTEGSQGSSSNKNPEQRPQMSNRSVVFFFFFNKEEQKKNPWNQIRIALYIQIQE